MIPLYKKDVRVSGCIRAAWGACPLLTLFRCRLQLRCWIGEPCSHNPTPSLRRPFAKVAFGYRRSACWAAYSQQDLKPLARSKAPPPPLCARYSLFGSPHEVLPRAIPARGRLASREMSSSSLLATWDFQVEMPQMFAAHGAALPPFPLVCTTPQSSGEKKCLENLKCTRVLHRSPLHLSLHG